MSRSTITPHASHQMGIVEGETCCVVCYAAPWMPIIEQQCQIGDTSPRERDALLNGEPLPERRNTKGHPESLLRRAIELHDVDGKRWEDVADALGLTGNGQTGKQAACALRVSVSRYRRAGCQRAVLGRPPKSSKTGLADAKARQASGVPLVDIAADMGLPYDSLRQRLRRNLVSEQKGAA